MPAYLVGTQLVRLGCLDPVMLVLEIYFTYSRFVVETFTVKKEEEKKKRKKNVLFLQNKSIGMCPGSKV